MSFANTSTTPNCERIDRFDQLNSRVWYQLTMHLPPKKDGSLHEITISYGPSYCSSNKKLPPPIPLADRIHHNPKSGVWPGTILCGPISECYDSDDNITTQNELTINHQCDATDCNTAKNLAILCINKQAKELFDLNEPMLTNLIELCRVHEFLVERDYFKRLKKSLVKGLKPFKLSLDNIQ